MHPVAGKNRAARRGIELDEDPQFERRYWKAQRVGWVVLALLLALAALGLFGEGYLSRASVRGQGVTVEYSRFARRDALSVLTIRVPASAAQAGEVQIAFNADYVSRLSWQSITPTPQRVDAAAKWVTFHFAASPQPGSLAFIFEAKHRQPGHPHVRVSVPGFPTLEFWQLVYP